jgi:hypothetical protein
MNRYALIRRTPSVIMGGRVVRFRVDRTLVVLAVAAITFISPAARAAKLVVSDAVGHAGAQVTMAVTLATEGMPVAATENDVSFSAPLAIAAKANGRPDCTVNPDIDKGATSFAFRPSGCVGATCSSVRALVVSTDNVAPIPDGSVLYTCSVIVAPGAVGGAYPLTVSGIVISDPHGNRVPEAAGCAGTLFVSGATPLPIPTSTVTPTATLTPTPTPTSTPTPTPSPTPCVGGCHDGNVITVDELLTVVNIALGNAPVSACRAGDPNGDGQVTIDEILAAVRNALYGCGGQPS